MTLTGLNLVQYNGRSGKVDFFGQQSTAFVTRLYIIYHKFYNKWSVCKSACTFELWTVGW